MKSVEVKMKFVLVFFVSFAVAINTVRPEKDFIQFVNDFDFFFSKFNRLSKR